MIISIYSSTKFFILGTVPAEILPVAIMLISYLSIVALFQWPLFSWESMVEDFFQWAHQWLKKKGIFNWPVFHGGAYMKTHIQIIYILLTLLCFLVSRRL